MSESITLNKDQKYLDDMCNLIMFNQRKYNIEALQNSTKRIDELEKAINDIIQERDYSDDLLKISYKPKQSMEQPDFQSYYNKVTQLEKIVEELKSKDEREDMKESNLNEVVFNHLNDINAISTPETEPPQIRESVQNIKVHLNIKSNRRNKIVMNKSSQLTNKNVKKGNL